MTAYTVRIAVLSPLVLAVGLVAARAQDQPPPVPLPPQPQGVEVLTHGPVHEAFAQPTTTRPEPGPVVTKQPPDPIEELPPDQRPEGDNVQWIPGYWAWDDEASDFVWVSGCWRDVPPGRRWVPGYWQAVEGGWVRVPGFWANDDVNQVQYLPPPPPSIDQGPANPPPNPNDTYVPGIWVYQNNRYLWRPGFWVGPQPGWVWVPAHYVWTPGGYLFVDGYWDYPLDQRGLLFAPVMINRPVFGAARVPFVPGYAVNPDFLLGALFVRLATGHYYFGDYFGQQYARGGYVPWPDYAPVRGAVDPTFAYYRRLHVADRQWETAFRRLYSARAAGEIPRPPRTLAAQAEAIRNVTVNKNQNVTVHKNVNLTHLENVRAVAPLNEVRNTRITNLAPLGGAKETATPRAIRLQEVRREERERELKAAAALRDGAARRREAEARILHQGKAPAQHTDLPHTTKWELPRVPAAVGTPRKSERTLPPTVTVPKHEERPVPKHEPPRPVRPPKKDKDKGKG